MRGFRKIENDKMVVLFENDVEMYGVQTDSSICCEVVTFENDVEMYGAQTKK